MGVDVSSLLAGFGAAFGGDILTTTMSIGGRDDRVGLLGGGLNAIFGTPSGIAGHGEFIESPVHAQGHARPQGNVAY